MSDPLDTILTLISDRGSDLAKADMDEIDYLTTQLDPEQEFEQRGMIYEAISIIVNDPLYQGDIDTLD